MRRTTRGFVTVIAFLWLCVLSPVQAREVKTLSDQTWTIWLDRVATWREDPLFLPPVNLAKLPVNPPTCGWPALFDKPGPRTTLPATVEEYFWGENGNGFGISGNYTGVSWFFTTFEAEADWKGKRVVLDFESVRLRAEVFVNERLVGYDLVNATPFAVDISGAVKPGTVNRLAVRITDPHGNFTGQDGQTYRWGNYKVPPSHGFGGITGPVRLTVSDRVFVEDVFVKNTPDVSTVDVEVTLRNVDVMPTQGTLTYRIVPLGESKALATAKEKIQSLMGRQVLSKRFVCKRAKPWSLETPQLYELELTWKGDNNTADSVTQRFGFRWFEVRDIEGDKQFYLNDKRVVLRGAVSSGFWPVNGIYPTPELARKQIESAKALGLNMLSFHRGIGQPIVLDMADELGLLYYEEPGGYGSGEDSDFARAFKREKLLRMVRRDRNHPSLIIYNMINEAARDPQENEIRDMADAHKLDETRAITFTSSHFPQTFYEGNCPLEPAPVKLHSLPYNPEPLQQGWWDCHHAGGPGVYLDGLYQGPTNFYRYLNHPSEIVFYGEDGAIGTPPRLQLIKDALEKGGNAGWDGRSYLAWFDAFDRFLTDKGFRDAFAGVDDLCRSLGRVSHYYQGRVIENVRIGNVVDGYVMNGWEDSKIENHSGLVDSFRNPKADPDLLATYNQPLYVAVKCRNKVVAVDSDVMVDFHLVNEADVRGDLTLFVTAEDDRGIYVEKQWPVQAIGGYTYGQLLVADVMVPTRTPGYTTIKAVLRQGKKEIATGRDQIYALVYDPGELTETVAVLDPNKEIQALFAKVGIAKFKEHKSGWPDVNCLVVGGGIPPGFVSGSSPLNDPMLDWVADGHTILVIKNADVWADFLADKEVVDYRGKCSMGALGYGGNYFVRQHPLFAGLPVNTAFNWEYQCLARYRDRNRFGLRLKGEQCVVGCYADNKPEVLTAVGIVPLGRGRIILSTLDLEAAIDGNERAAIMARRILLNYLKYATGVE